MFKRILRVYSRETRQEKGKSLKNTNAVEMPDRRLAKEGYGVSVWEYLVSLKGLTPPRELSVLWCGVGLSQLFREGTSQCEQTSARP